ncbi:MAG TPA: hypothetical protein VHD56_06785 [Tepidisphaeraceae bacterium]|nr:hypothetical protein [Tepidisphaeraceae bacterium]
MRFLFRGIVRETGKSVEGHVEAPHAEEAYEILGDNGIVTESLREDPKPLNMSPNPMPFPEIADALESALDSSSSQVAFDDLAERYRGKNVWVIDRNKIRSRVAQVVDQALATSEANAEGASTARQRVATAISGLFNDTRNIASQHSEASIAGMRAIGNGPGNAQATITNESLEQQIARLTGVVRQAEGLVAAMATALRNMGSGSEARRRAVATPANNGKQNEVLLEIFKSNLDLRNSMASAELQAPVQAA